jgi:pimeloyl-ACP methyl ester carboxylesterase
VIDAVGLDRFALLGISQGAAIAVVYAVRHPERVTHLVLYGGYLRGRQFRGVEARREEEALISVIRAGWTDPDPTFRHLFSMLFLPHGTSEQMSWYDTMQRRSTSATAARLFEARHSSTTSVQASSITRPTPVCPTCRRTSPPSNASCGHVPPSRWIPRTGARRCAGTWSFLQGYAER